MELELLPAVSLLPETLSVLVAPEDMLARALNGNPRLQQFRIIFITGIRSGSLGRLDRSSGALIPFWASTIVRGTGGRLSPRYDGRVPPFDC